MQCVRLVRGAARLGKLLANSARSSGVVRLQRARRVVRAPGRDVDADLEALGRVRRRLRVGDRRVRDRCTRWRGCTPSRRRCSLPGLCGAVDVEPPASCRCCAWSSPVITTTAFSPRGKYQKRGSGLRSAFIERDQVRQQPLLFVGLRDGDLVEVHPVGLGAAEEEIVRADRRLAVALLARPRGIALPRVDDRPRKIVGERRRLAAVAADAPQRDRRVRRSRSSPWRRGSRSRRRRSACRGRRCRGTASSRRRCPRPEPRPCSPAGTRSPSVVAASVRPSRAASCLSGRMAIEVAAGGHPVREHRHLRRRQRHLTEDDHVVGRERRRRDRGDVRRRVNAFRPSARRISA